MTTAERRAPGDRLTQGRPLTHPTEGVKNHGFDNINDDLIVCTGDVLEPPGGKRYNVEDALGQGTFGQVVRCTCPETNLQVAVKIIKNQDAYFQQARVEIGILKLLGDNYSDRRNIVRLLEYFVFREHLCLVFELLDANLYDLLKRNRYRGLSIQLVWFFVKQLLDALVTLRDERIIHCDLKPENILLKDQNSGRVKVIDFGSACLEHKTVYSYIQSRFYRSPEVVVGYPYNTAIDMWSLGCVAAELFLGLPLFPAASERDLLARIMEVLGSIPDSVLDQSKHNMKYYKKVDDGNGTKYQFLSEEEFEEQNNISHPSGKRYFEHQKLADIIGAYPHRSGMSEEEQSQENERRLSFTDFLLGVLDINPLTRWTPHQAALHPFVRGEPFTGPFQPPPPPEPRGKSDPMRIQIPNPRTHGHSASWHPDAVAFSATFMNSPAHDEIQIQAHRAAMAAVCNLSPQVSPHFHAHHFHGSAPRGYGNHSMHGPVNHGVRGGSDTLGRSMGDIRGPPPRSFASGMSPGTYGTPTTMFQSNKSNHVSQRSPVYNAAMMAVQAAVGSQRSVGRMPSNVRPQLIPPHPSQNGIHGEGQTGTIPIVGFTVSHSTPQTNTEQRDGSRLEVMPNKDPKGTLTANFVSQPAACNDVFHDFGSLSLESPSVGGNGGEMTSAAQMSDLGTSFPEGDDDGGEALSETARSNPGDCSEQEFVVGPFEVPVEGNGLQGIQTSLSHSSAASATRSGDPHTIRNWNSNPYPIREQFFEQSTCDSVPSCISEMQQHSLPGLRQQRSHSHSDVPIPNIGIDEPQRRYSMSQANCSDLRCTEDGMRVPPPGFSGSRGSAQLPHVNFSGPVSQHQTGPMDIGYTKRRSQTESFSNLPVLQENQPMVVREYPEQSGPGSIISPQCSGNSGAQESTWPSAIHPPSPYLTMDSGLDRSERRYTEVNAPDRAFPPASMSHTSFMNMGS